MSKDIWSSTWGSLIGVTFRKPGYISFNSGSLRNGRWLKWKKVDCRGEFHLGISNGRGDWEYLNGLLDIRRIFSCLFHLQICLGYLVSFSILYCFCLLSCDILHFRGSTFREGLLGRVGQGMECGYAGNWFGLDGSIHCTML